MTTTGQCVRGSHMHCDAGAGMTQAEEYRQAVRSLNELARALNQASASSEFSPGHRADLLLWARSAVTLSVKFERMTP